MLKIVHRIFVRLLRSLEKLPRNDGMECRVVVPPLAGRKMPPISIVIASLPSRRSNLLKLLADNFKNLIGTNYILEQSS
jgi:hypothetical protein